MSVQSIGEMGKDFCPNLLQPFLEYIDRRSCNDEAGSLFQYFTTLFFGGGQAGGRKYKFRSISRRLVNILKAVIRPA